MTEHTQGWTFEDDSRIYGSFEEPPTHDGILPHRVRRRVIATVHGKDNGPLLAAAPDLLASLRRIVSWIDAGCDPSSKSIEEARAAIAKATTPIPPEDDQ